MKRWVKWTVGVIGVLVVVAAATTAVVGTQQAERKSQHVQVKLQPVTWATTAAAPDASTLARGKDVARNNFPISDQNAVLPNGRRAEADRVRKIQG